MRLEPEAWQRQINEGQGAFFYPPTMGVIAIPTALLSWKMARHAFDMLNILCLLLICFFSGQIVKSHLSLNHCDSRIWVGMAASCLMSAVPETIFTGQTPLIALAGCLGALYFLQRQQLIIGALCIVIASIKPQLSILPVLFLLISARSWLFFGWSSLFVSMASLGVFMLGGDYNPLSIIENAANTHASLKPNDPSNTPGIYWLFTLLGVPPAINVSAPITGTLTITALAFWSAKHRIVMRRDTQALLFVIATPFAASNVLMPLHSYDYVSALFPVVVIAAISQQRTWLIFIPSFLLIARPDNIAHAIHVIFQNQWMGITINSVMIESLGAIGLLAAISGIAFRQRDALRSIS